MDEMERLLRAAMTSAADQAPPGLIEAVRRRHRLHVRRVGMSCAAIAVAIASVVPAVLHATLGSATQPGSTPSSSAAVPSSSPTAAPGTLLLTCDAANWGQLPSTWRSGSLHVGPLWFVDGRQFGYVHYVSSGSGGGSTSGTGGPREGVMIVEVANGSRVTMQATRAARPYFRFVDGYNGPSPNELPAGDTGYTFVACPHDSVGPNGDMTDFYLGFVIQAGRSAEVTVWTTSARPPVRLIFSCPGRGCEG